MKGIHKIKAKVFYRYANMLIKRETMLLPTSLINKKNLFLYFDYEREFGNPNAKITDNDVSELLKLLDDYKIKATWFTVGKIFDFYSDSIKNIIQAGHEIGSHTYNHIKPFDETKKNLQKDFELFKISSEQISMVSGFHSPEGKWSMELIRQLAAFNYRYDLISNKRKRDYKISITEINDGKKIIRFESVGDDWQLFMANSSPQDCYNFFVQLINHIRVNEIGGIGFHPWILFSNKNILDGFKLFLNYLETQEDFQIVSITEVLNLISEKQK